LLLPATAGIFRRKDDNPTAGETFSDVVVRIADEGYADAGDKKGAEALTGGAG
jgi:hypothetical protein